MRPSAPRFAFVALLALAALPLVPTAAACTFAGEGPPPPGGFIVVDLADGTEYRVEVEARGLGGTCELSNPAAVSGGYIAWIDGTGDDRRLRLRDLHATDDARSMPIGGTSHEISLFDHTVLLPERARLRVIDLDAGTQRHLPLPEEGPWALGGHLFAYLDGFGTEATLSVYDAREDAWLVRDRPMPELGARWWPWHLSATWLVLHSEWEDGSRPPSRHHLLDLVTGELSDLALPAFTSTFDLDGDHLYFPLSYEANGTPLDPPVLARMRLPDGAVERVATPMPWEGSVAEGLVLLRAYSLQTHEPLRLLSAESPSTTPTATSVTAPPPLPSRDSEMDPSAPAGGRTVPGAPLVALGGLAVVAFGSAAAERWRKALRRRR